MTNPGIKPLTRMVVQELAGRAAAQCVDQMIGDATVNA